MALTHCGAELRGINSPSSSPRVIKDPFLNAIKSDLCSILLLPMRQPTEDIGPDEKERVFVSFTCHNGITIRELNIGKCRCFIVCRSQFDCIGKYCLCRK